jgi:hypothetical protein
MSILLRSIVWTVLWGGAVSGAGLGGRAEYIGGTAQSFKAKTDGRLDTTDEKTLRFDTGKKSVEVPYESIHNLEYGQKVDRRYVSAVLISPLFLLAKARKHFLTIGYTDAEGKQQAMIFQVNKGDIRALLVGLEARTGRKVTFQDEEARKAGKG